MTGNNLHSRGTLREPGAIIDCDESRRRRLRDGSGRALESNTFFTPARVPDVPIVVGTTLSEAVEGFGQPGVEIRDAATPAALVNDIYRREACHVLLITAPVVLPPLPLATAVDLADSDLRCASVAFLSNAAGFLSFPHRDSPSIHQILRPRRGKHHSQTTLAIGRPCAVPAAVRHRPGCPSHIARTVSCWPVPRSWPGCP